MEKEYANIQMLGFVFKIKTLIFVSGRRDDTQIMSRKIPFFFSFMHPTPSPSLYESSGNFGLSCWAPPPFERDIICA